MKNSLMQVIFVVTALFASSLVVAQSEGPEETDIANKIKKNLPISVTVSADIQNKIAKLPPAARKRVKDAISAGGEFMQHYLDGYVCMWDAPEWNADMIDLVADTDHIYTICQSRGGPQRDNNGREYTVWHELCSQVFLRDFKLEDGTATLTYQVIEIGETHRFVTATDPTFSAELTGKRVPITVTFDLSNKVSNFVPVGGGYESLYAGTLDYLDRYWKVHEQVKRAAAQVCK